jgi:predicted transcriptional regulator
MTLSSTRTEPHQSAEESKEVAYGLKSSRYDIYECARCDNVVLAVGRDEPSISCHDKPMERVTATESSVKPPNIKQVFFQVFGLPKAGNDICLRVISEGPLSANEIAESMGYDRSTTTRYLNNLYDLGMLQRSELNREGGGVVHVYHSADLEQSRYETLIGFCTWVGEAAALIEDANVTKQECFDENLDQELQNVFWKSFGKK